MWLKAFLKDWLHSALPPQIPPCGPGPGQGDGHRAAREVAERVLPLPGPAGDPGALAFRAFKVFRAPNSKTFRAFQSAWGAQLEDF